ncbi:MAG: N-acetylglucosamine-6-phosphate deacetylase [Bacteroidetes bacterium]|nr:N-acetylglucosamine-6-phosphate deacetylase [Bacteroidota bacterium]MBS1648361.1 N-acetylglucosamine-6-phosphate deacetylase [Bacteroidota bacterium]
MQKIFSANKIFTGNNWLYNHSIITENEIIIDIVPNSSINKPTHQKTYTSIIPAFIDIQIYGGHGKLFSVYQNTDALFELNKYCSNGGALHFCPTVATNSIDVFLKCIDAVKEYWNKGGKGCIGLHLEGPWINKIKRGAHIESFIHSPTIEEVKTLLAYGKDVIKIITLAPEVCSNEVIKLIQSYNIVISAGHSNATYTEATNAFNNGIPTATHLFNAMSALQHREPGFVGAVFNHSTVKASIIPDGYHVDYAAITIAKKIMQERLFVITDAVTDTVKGPYPHELSGDKYVSSGILSGSALTMIKAVKNLVAHCNIELDEALRMCSLYPAQVVGLSNELGKIEKGFKACLIEVNDELTSANIVC